MGGTEWVCLATSTHPDSHASLPSSAAPGQPQHCPGLTAAAKGQAKCLLGKTMGSAKHLSAKRGWKRSIISVKIQAVGLVNGAEVR